MILVKSSGDDAFSSADGQMTSQKPPLQHVDQAEILAGMIKGTDISGSLSEDVRHVSLGNRMKEGLHAE